MLDLPKKCDLFHYSIGLEPVGSVHFRAPARHWQAGAIERGAARAADAKIFLQSYQLYLFCQVVDTLEPELQEVKRVNLEMEQLRKAHFSNFFFICMADARSKNVLPEIRS